MNTYLTRFDVDRVSILSSVDQIEVQVPWPNWQTQPRFIFLGNAPLQVPTPGIDLNFDWVQPGAGEGSVAVDD